MKKEKKKIRLFNFSRKLALLCVIPLVVMCYITSSMSTRILTSNLEGEIESSLKIVATSLEETYSSLYEGDYAMSQSGKLYKGETTISGDTTLLDSLKENTGFESSFYYDNRVIITTIMRTAGGRITGSDHMPNDIYQAVIKDGKDAFLTNLKIQETEYYAYFKPLVNADGSIAGCIFAGKPAAEVNSQIKAETNKITLYSVIISAVFIVLILIFARGMARNMKRTKSFLEIVSTGDLRQEANKKALKRNDELGDMYNISFSLQEELKSIVTNIKTSASELTNSSDDLMNISQNTIDSVASVYDSVEFISKGAADQANQTSTAVLQVTNMGEQIDSISEDVVSLSESASKMSDAEKASTDIIKELNVSNEEMIDSIENIAKQIELTNSSVQNIREAIVMIQAISDETDLLAINASIEAAHAGEAGRGFAVVAEEIGKLAAQSSNNATEIESAINTLLEHSNSMVTYMDQVKVKIAEQSQKLDQTTDTFSTVARGVDTTRLNIQNITKGMSELKASRDVILDVITDLSALSEEYAASTHGTIDAAEKMNDAMKSLELASGKLKDMSDNLTNEIEIFKI